MNIEIYRKAVLSAQRDLLQVAQVLNFAAMQDTPTKLQSLEALSAAQQKLLELSLELEIIIDERSKSDREKQQRQEHGDKLLARYESGETQKDLAAELGLSPTTVREKISSAKKRRNSGKS